MNGRVVSKRKEDPMTNHLSTAVVSGDSGLLPNQSFFSWLKTQTILFVSQVLGFVYFVASLIYYSLGVTHLKEGESFFVPKTIKLLADYAHIVFIVLFIFALIRILDDNERGSYRVRLVYKRVFNPKGSSKHKVLLTKSKIQLREFKRYFLCFWSAMLLLYISFAVTHSLNPNKLTTVHTSDKGEEIFRQIDNVKVSLQIDKVTPGAETKAEGQDENQPQNIELMRFFNFALNNISMLFMFFCFLILSSPSYNRESKKKFKRHIIQATVGLVVFTIISPLFGPTVCAALSGLLNAVVLAILIARLDSKLIGLPSWLISVLYFYSALQPFFMLFEQKEDQLQGMEATVLILLLIFKVYFFLIITYTLQTGRMLNYLLCFPFLSKGSTPDKKRNDSTVDDKAVHSVSENESLSDPTFFTWLRNPITLVLSIGVLIALALSFPIARYQLHKNGMSFEIGFYIYWVHVLYLPIIVAMMLIWMLGPKNRVSYLIRKLRLEKAFPAGPASWLYDRLGYSRQEFRLDEGDRVHDQFFHNPPRDTAESRALVRTSKAQLKDFKRYFLFFWTMMLVLYISFVLKVPDDSSATDILSKAAAFNRISVPFSRFALNNLGMLPLFWCFVVLYLPSHESGSKTYDQESKKRQILLINYSCLTLALLIAFFPLLLFFIKGGGFEAKTLREYSTAFGAVSATLNAVVLALLIARLDSKLIRLPSPLILLLYLYSAIQIFYVLLDLREPVFKNLLACGLFVVLFLKIYLFLVITYAIDTGRMFNYLFCFPFLSTRVNSIFDNQYEIKTHAEAEHSFSFSITKKGLLVYFTDTKCRSRKECDRTIDNLRLLMEDRDAYHPREICGTHWIEVWDSNSDIVCQSTGLRSEDEAADLKEESIEKIPYCKYDRG